MKPIAITLFVVMAALPARAAIPDDSARPVATTEVIEVVEMPATAETGTNISGESEATTRRQIFQDTSIQKDADVRIEVPLRPDGRPQRPVRGLNQTEKMELNDLEYRYQMGQIGEAEYYSRRHAIMERLGLEPEY